MPLPKREPTATGHCRYDRIRRQAGLDRWYNGWLFLPAMTSFGMPLGWGLAWLETRHAPPPPGLARYGIQHRSSPAPERGADCPRRHQPPAAAQDDMNLETLFALLCAIALGLAFLRLQEQQRGQAAADKMKASYSRFHNQLDKREKLVGKPLSP